MFIKTARLGTHLGVSSLETPFSEFGRMSSAKVIQKIIPTIALVHI